MTGIGAVAALQGITIEPKFELVKLYGMEDLRRAAIARHSLDVAITVKYAKWDASNDTIFNDVIGSDFTSISKNLPAMFTLTATFASMKTTATDTVQYQEYTVSDIVFEGVPINMNPNEFIIRELTGSARVATMAGS